MPDRTALTLLLQGIPADEETLLPKLRELLVDKFGAKAR